MSVSRATTVEYAPGRLADIIGAPDRPVVLLWHGMSVDHRSCLLNLAREVADKAFTVVVVDWNPTSDDRGRSDLLASVRFASDWSTRHGRGADDLVVVGWSLGGTAAVSLAVHGPNLGVGLRGVVLVAPAADIHVVDPISGSPLPHPLPSGSGRCRVEIVYGTADTVTPPDSVCGLELRLRASGWSTTLHAVEADHGGVVGARYHSRTEQYLPSTDAGAVIATAHVAAIVADAAGR